MSTTGADIWFDLPPVFHELPLYDDEAGTRSRRLREVALAFADGASANEQEGFLRSLDIALSVLRAQGARYWGVALVRSEDGSLSTANLSVMTRQVPGGAAPKHIVAALNALVAGPDRTVAVRELPAGPAAVITRELTQPLGAFGFDQVVTVRSVQYVLAHPDGGHLAIFDLSTTYTRDWNDYLRIMEVIAHSISFVDPALAADHVLAADRIRSIMTGGS